MPRASQGILTDPTVADINEIENRVRNAITQLAVSDIQSITGRDQVVVRDLLPDQDLETTSDNGWTDTDNKWETTGFTADQFSDAYGIDSTARAENKIIAIYAISNVAANPVTTEIQFETGSGAPFEQLQVEGMLTDEEVIGLLADPIIYGADQDGTIRQYQTGAADEVVYHGVVAEQKGSTFEDIPSRRLSGHGGGGAGPAGR